MRGKGGGVNMPHFSVEELFLWLAICDWRSLITVKISLNTNTGNFLVPANVNKPVLGQAVFQTYTSHSFFLSVLRELLLKIYFLLSDMMKWPTIYDQTVKTGLQWNFPHFRETDLCKWFGWCVPFTSYEPVGITFLLVIEKRRLEHINHHLSSKGSPTSPTTVKHNALITFIFIVTIVC